MTTYLRSGEAARRLGVTTNTLYAYVSRGRVSRILGADGRTSLFDLDEIDVLRERSRRGPVEPPPSIDVRIATGITRLDEDGPSYRGHRIDDLVHLGFERVAELLWTGTIPDHFPSWQAAPDTGGIDGTAPSTAELVRLTLDVATDGRDPLRMARELYATIPVRFDSALCDERPLSLAIAGIWTPRPDAAFVRAIDRTLVLLADHELATSTLAARVATSTQANVGMSIVAGLAAVAGDLHGGAARRVHQLLENAARRDAHSTIADAYADTGRVPGFGHAIYRNRDPRFDLLMASVRDLPDPAGRLATVEAVIDDAATLVPEAPNIDLAVGALTWVSGLPADTPLFAIARIAGWVAHHLEELDAKPLRFRGLAR